MGRAQAEPVLGLGGALIAAVSGAGGDPDSAAVSGELPQVVLGCAARGPRPYRHAGIGQVVRVGVVGGDSDHVLDSDSRPVSAHNSVVGADQGFRAPSWDQESVRDSVHEDSGSARIAAGQRPRPSFRHPQGSVEPSPCFGGLASQSFELLHRPSDEMFVDARCDGIQLAGGRRLRSS